MRRRGHVSGCVSTTGCGAVFGFVAMTASKINAISECNPLLGPQLMETIRKVVVDKGTVEKWIKTKESDFMAADAAAALPNRQN